MNIIFSSKKTFLISMLFIIVFMTGCTNMKVVNSNLVILPSDARIVVGPLANFSDTPLANRQVESILVSLLQANGFRQISLYPRHKSCEKLLYCPDEAQSKSQVIQWARSKHFNYLIMGATNEWRYKVGLDGEPVAGVSLQVVDVPSGRTIWTSVGSVIGGSRSGLDLVGQSLLKCLLATISVSHNNQYTSKATRAK